MCHAHLNTVFFQNPGVQRGAVLPTPIRVMNKLVAKVGRQRRQRPAQGLHGTGRVQCRVNFPARDPPGISVGYQREVHETGTR